MGNEVRIKATVDDKVTGPLGKIHDKFDTLGKSAGFKAVAQGVGMGAGISAFNLLGSAVDGVTSFLGDSVHAYQEEQASVAKLDASLKANVAGYDGNRDAIEKVLSARMKLGFSDEEQRASLAGLVGATHDVNKALEIQSTAMDLARFKHISLADASEALTKVEAGSYRVLKSLGIVLKDGATQTDALAAVQRVATGQAEAYANTNEGKVLASQIKVNEAEEKFGKVLSKLEAEILPILATAIGAVADAFDALGIGSEKTMADMEKAVANGTYGAAARLDTMRKNADDAVWGMRSDLESKHGAIQLAASNVAKPIGRAFNEATVTARKAVRVLPGQLAFDLRAGYDDIESASTALGEAMKNPIKKAARERALQDILDGKGSVGRRLAAGLRSSDPVVVQAAAKLKADVLAELAGLRHITMSVEARVNVTYHGKNMMRAAGGPVTAGETYVVGEQGPELFTPRTSGGITSNSALRSGSGSGGGGMTVIFNSNFAPTRDQANEIARVIGAAMDRRTSYARTNPTFVPA